MDTGTHVIISSTTLNEDTVLISKVFKMDIASSRWVIGGMLAMDFLFTVAC